MKLYSFARGLSPYLTAYLLLVSLGLPLHKVYCACKGESEVSLFLAIEHECGHLVAEVDGQSPLGLHRSKDSKQSNTTTTKPGCCSDKSALSCSVDAEADHDCGGEETIIAKLTTNYLFDQEKSLLDGANFCALLPKVLIFELPIGPASAKELPIRGPTPPPLPYGRELLVRGQVFLC